jgi:small subunit ribosomal protein S11
MADTTKQTIPKVEEAPAVETAVPNTPAAAATTAVATEPVKKKKVKRSVTAGQLHIMATFNNTIVTFTDNNGGVLTVSSAGACGFRGSKKGTAYAAQVAGEKAGQNARQTYY